jgi:hypothetical protein
MPELRGACSGLHGSRHSASTAALARQHAVPTGKLAGIFTTGGFAGVFVKVGWPKKETAARDEVADWLVIFSGL